MERVVLPLLLASRAFASEDARERLDRIRMQKGVFLLVKRGSPAWSSLYTFRPYNWGPYCSDLVGDLGSLVSSGRLADDSTHAGLSYGIYRTTLLGEETIQRYEFSQSELEYVGKVRSYIGSQSFAKLLNGIYKAYPNYATNSIFTR